MVEKLKNGLSKKAKMVEKWEKWWFTFNLDVGVN